MSATLVVRTRWGPLCNMVQGGGVWRRARTTGRCSIRPAARYGGPLAGLYKVTDTRTTSWTLSRTKESIISGWTAASVDSPQRFFSIAVFEREARKRYLFYFYRRIRKICRDWIFALQRKRYIIYFFISWYLIIYSRQANYNAKYSLLNPYTLNSYYWQYLIL